MQTETRLLIGLTTNDGKPVDPEAVIRFVGERERAFNVAHTAGYWEGKREESLTFTFYHSGDSESLESLARHMAVAFAQTAVLVAHAPANVAFVGAN